MNVYRFRDRVAVNPPDGPTFYLTASQAESLGNALHTIADDIPRGPFHESTVGPVQIETDSD